MDKVLSQEEINALFSAMSSEELSSKGQPDKGAGACKIASYDFHCADRISQDQMRSIHLLHENFGRSFASSLSAYLRAFVDVSLASLEHVSYAAFIKALPDPTLFASISMRPLDSNIALELNPSLVFPMIDMILGGPGHAFEENRNFTEIELNIVEGVIKLAMRDLCGAWQAIMELDLSLEGKGTKAQMFQIVSPAETVIAVHFKLKIGDNSGMMNLCIPSRTLKMLRNNFDQQRTTRRQKPLGSEAEKILELVKPVPVSLSSEIRRSKATLQDLLRVAIGDVIELNERINDPVYLCVGGIPKFCGKIVQRCGKRSLEITAAYKG
jgi:flagellar motor switch protein FliM